MKKDYKEEIKKQIMPILLSALGAFLITVGNSIVGGGDPCIAQAMDAKQAGIFGGVLKAGHSAFKNLMNIV